MRRTHITYTAEIICIPGQINLNRASVFLVLFFMKELVSELVVLFGDLMSNSLHLIAIPIRVTDQTIAPEFKKRYWNHKFDS